MAAAKAVAVVVVLAILTEISKYHLMGPNGAPRLHPPHLFGPFIHKDRTLVVVVGTST